MTLVQRSKLSDSVQRFVATNEDIDESFAVLNVATDYGATHDEPMTLEAAIETIHRIAAKIEAM